MNAVDTQQAPSAAQAAAHSYFGTLAPISKAVEWNGHVSQCELRILEAGEIAQVMRFAYGQTDGRTTSDEYLQAQNIALAAGCLVRVDGKLVDDECKTERDRLQMASELPDSLLEAIVEAYGQARQEPIAFLADLQQDDAEGKDEPASEPGSPSESWGYGMDASYPQSTGPSPSSI